MLFSFKAIFFLYCLIQIFFWIDAIPVHDQNSSLITIDGNGSTSPINMRYTPPPRRTTTAPVIYHNSHTTVYVGVGCGCGGLLGLIILYCICKS